VILEELSPSCEAEWDAFVDARPDATCYHLRAWQRVAVRAYGMEAPHLLARDRPGGPVRGVLPLFVVDGALGSGLGRALARGLPKLADGPLGRYVATGLFGAYGPVLADGEDAARALLEQARRVTRRTGARYLIVKALGAPPVPEGFTRHVTSVVATLALPRDADVLWKGFKDKQRNSIRKAQRPDAGLEHRRGGVELLPVFYDVLAENMHRKGTPIYGFPMMRELALGLGDRAEVHTLWKDGEVVSGAFAIHYNGTYTVPFASSRAAHFKLNPNNLIYWEMLRRAVELGCARFDFGRSPRESSTLAFKRSWGAVEMDQPFYVWSARGAAPTLDAHDPGVERLVKFWMSLPRPVADALGPAITARFLV
jgi:FemAB-related protein (PEP-CTERM system-associated)